MKPEIDAVIAAYGWSPTTFARLMGKRQVVGDCWVFMGTTAGDGYGYLYTGPGRNQRQLVHRLAYLFLVGPIPDGKVLDHLCRNRACFNPDCLEPVTIGENNIRGSGPESKRNHNGLCRNDLHPWPEEAVVCTDGYRRCRPCQQASDRRYKERRAMA